MGQFRTDPWVFAAVVAGAALRLINLGAAPLWFDETFTAQHLAVPWGGYVGSVMRDNQAPLYYVVLKAWTDIAGTSPWALRLPGSIASVLCIPLVAVVTRLVAGTTAFRTAAWVAAVSPYLIQHAQDARPYALLAALALAHLLVLLHFTTGRTARLGAFWVALAVAVIATHYYGIFFLAGQGAALLLLWRRPVSSWLPAGVVAGVLSAGIVLAAVATAAGGFAGDYVFGVAAVPGVVWSMLTGYTLLPTSEQLHELGPRAIMPDLPIALAALPAFAVVVVAGLRALDASTRTVLLVSFGAALLAPFLYRLAAGAGVHPRYFAAAIGPLLVVTAIGMRPDRLGSLRGGATVVLGIVMLYATVLHLRDTGHGREDVAAAGRWLDANVPSEEEILVTSSEMAILGRFHWPGRRLRLFPAEKGIVPAERIPAIVESMPFTGPDRTILVVGRAWLTDPDGRLQDALRARYPTCVGTTVAGIRIHCFRRDAARSATNAIR